MKTINMHEAKTHLSSLIEKAVQGESFIISKAGKPLVRVTRVEAPTQTTRTGFLQGQLTVPDDFDAMGAKHIATLFAGSK
ncbi:type II toxin-antitoxin system prevent-host-death family antitoxin [Polynucleobacter sp. MWH-Mekk-B1]|uniref:type II toxin-antitoxin system Phd/YefM family antitoxin n=1 Tax=Polynucleobacter finlandensis TaxID=1855894 RepID=UPI001C0B436B|nr:type II toxin-antitoxin system prevent-host-death family antitoxin [Polynucleobacter finlandensis]MBU3545149.1 type II toxin-antitoxin system prevent-host-death family antitoxin [Polynucleobacter finlandensis]